MLETLFPQAAVHYRALPLLGPLTDEYVRWLAARGYREGTLRVMVSPLTRIDRWLRRQGIEKLTAIDKAILTQCRTSFPRFTHCHASAVRALGRYLTSKGLVRTQPPDPPTPSEKLIRAYAQYLEKVRGFAQSTIVNHTRTAGKFLEDVGQNTDPAWLGALRGTDIEAFVRARGQQLRRTSLQQLVAHLRGFLRFLTIHVETLSDLDINIDTPRVYRHEQLPHTLPWKTVRALLESIDRRTMVGLRDYTMILLIATYGLRVSEVAAMTLDDIQWRQGRLRVPRSKTQGRLLLPLTDRAGSVVLHYLHHGRPSQTPCRNLFVHSRAPLGPLAPTSVSKAFARQARLSKLKIPFAGAHCLRHSYAVHLLRNGIPLKTIGDLLGHQSTESTCVYLRLETDDLRQVPLSIPRALENCPNLEARP